MSKVVAIDGPSGAGKGTVARVVAKALGWQYIDSGAMYRAVAWKTKNLGQSLNDEDAVVKVASMSSFEIREDTVTIDGYDVTTAIRTPEIDVAAATVASMPKVRSVLVSRQREYAVAGPVVMEGRDIGTVVFPDAVVKIYLDALPQERAKRRANDPAHRFSQMDTLGVVADALKARDHLDRTRQTSPLMTASDAEVVDTTGVSVDSVVSLVLEIVREKTNS
jgi:cytidylate kinase